MDNDTAVVDDVLVHDRPDKTWVDPHAERRKDAHIPMSHTIPVVSSEANNFASTSQEWSTVSPGKFTFMSLPMNNSWSV